jgi:hypothetical protein
VTDPHPIGACTDPHLLCPIHDREYYPHHAIHQETPMFGPNPYEGQPPLTRTQAAEYEQVVRDARQEASETAGVDPARSERAHQFAESNALMIRTRGIRN